MAERQAPPESQPRRLQTADEVFAFMVRVVFTIIGLWIVVVELVTWQWQFLPTVVAGGLLGPFFVAGVGAMADAILGRDR